MWASLSRADRERLIRTSCPHIPISKSNSKCVCGCQDMSGMKILMPELTLESLVAGPNDLVSLLQTHGCGNDDQDFHDINYIRSIEGIALPAPTWPPRRMVLLQPTRGTMFDIKQMTPDITRLFESGMVFHEQTWINVSQSARRVPTQLLSSFFVVVVVAVAVTITVIITTTIIGRAYHFRARPLPTPPPPQATCPPQATYI